MRLQRLPHSKDNQDETREALLASQSVSPLQLQRQSAQESLENQEFSQTKFEANGLQLKEKRGTISPDDQQRLGVLQRKMDDFWGEHRAKSQNQPSLLNVLSRKSVPGVQAKLEVGAPDDAYEQEADSMAGAVMNMARPTIQRLASEGKEAKGEEPAAKQPEQAGKRIEAAEKLVAELKKLGTKYKQQTNAKERWETNEFADCTKFLQLVLENSGEGQLLGGRANAQTGAMRGVIEKLKKEKEAFRLTGPKPGDIMMWEGHAAIVTEVVVENDQQKLVFAHMGGGGANLIGKKVDEKSGKAVYWLNASDTKKIDDMGSGKFLGYWTP